MVAAMRITSTAASTDSATSHTPWLTGQTLNAIFPTIELAAMGPK